MGQLTRRDSDGVDRPVNGLAVIPPATTTQQGAVQLPSANGVAGKYVQYNTSVTASGGYAAKPWDQREFDTTAGAINQSLPVTGMAEGDQLYFANIASPGAADLNVTGTGGPFPVKAGHGQTFVWSAASAVWKRGAGHKTVASEDYRYLSMPGVSVKDPRFGAKGDGTTDDTAAIQSAIDYCLYTAGAPKHVFIPYGVYKTSDVIHVGYGENYRTITLEGETSFGADQSTPISAIVPTFNDRPGLNVQGARKVVIKNLALVGRNLAFIYANSGSNADRSVLANWYGPNISSSNNTQYAPYAGIAIDAYAGAQPTTHYPTVTYPTVSGIGTTQYNKNYSSYVTFENVQVKGFVVGLVVQPGQVPDGSNGDFISLRDCDLSSNIVGYADGHADARNINIDNTRIHTCYTALDSLSYGNQHGSLAFNARGSSFDNCFRILNISIDGSTIQGTYPVHFDGCYAESLYSIGIGYAGSLTHTAGISFSECKFQFSVLNSEFSPIYVYSAPGSDLYLRNVLLNGGYGFHSFNANVKGESIAMDKLIADAFIPTSTPGRVAESYTCGIWAKSSIGMRVRPNVFYDFYGWNYYPVIDSESMPLDIAVAHMSDGTGNGVPIPWFVNQLSYGRAKYPVTDVAPLTFDRATYNLSSVSQGTGATGSQYTFTVGQGFISDALGAAALTNSYQTYSLGKGDIVVDNATGLTFFIVSVSFSTTVSATIVMQQINGIKSSGSNWTTTGTLGTSTGTMTVYNARRVYPSYQRVDLTATSANGAITLKLTGAESSISQMVLPIGAGGNGDYMISSAKSQSAVDSVFPQTKISSINYNNGAVTMDQNARRSYYGETPLFVRGTL